MAQTEQNIDDLELPEDPKILEMPATSRPIPLLLIKPIKVVNAKSAKRLFSRLILAFQKGEIESKQAKDLAYLLVSFLQSCNQQEFEDRLDRLEEKAGKK